MGLEIANEMLVAVLAEAFTDCQISEASRERQTREQPEEDQNHV